MKVRLKEDINIKDLAKDNWNGCQLDTLHFIADNYKANGEQEVFEVKKRLDIYLIDGYVVNPIAFEIIEEDKKQYLEVLKMQMENMRQTL